MKCNSDQKHKRLVFLDYLRIFAFSSVLIGHKFWQEIYDLKNKSASAWRWLAQILWPWVHGGGAGVLVFFLVSGYIITYILQEEKTGEFLVKRFFRIYPLYIVAVLIQWIEMKGASQAVSLNILIWQLTLLGDWVGAPYSLDGAEWTLRLELTFYFGMAALNKLQLLKYDRRRYLPWVYLVVVVTLYMIGPWPVHTDWALAYFSLYFPVLLMGSCIQLAECRSIKWHIASFFLLTSAVIHYYGLVVWQPTWINDHFLVRAFALFVVLWLMRRKLPKPQWLIWLSDLTYAIYLFHNWAFDLIRSKLSLVIFVSGFSKLGALIILFAICVAMVYFIEKPAISFGRSLAGRLYIS